MKPQTIILHGRSGAGKGTQAKLLQEYIAQKDPENRIVYISTGSLLRAFMEGDSLAARKVKAMLDKGGLMPDFLPVWLWTECLNKNISTGKEHIILDGVGRRALEAPMMTSAFDFFDRPDPVVIILDVSRERAFEHLKKRGRYDDNDADINARLDWYEQNVVPVLEYFKTTPRYRVIELNGERGIEEVHRDIISHLGI